MLRQRTHLRPKRESSKTSVAIVIVIIPFFYKLRYFNFDLVGIDPRAKGGQRKTGMVSKRTDANVGASSRPPESSVAWSHGFLGATTIASAPEVRSA